MISPLLKNTALFTGGNQRPERNPVGNKQALKGMLAGPAMDKVQIRFAGNNKQLTSKELIRLGKEGFKVYRLADGTYKLVMAPVKSSTQMRI